MIIYYLISRSENAQLSNYKLGIGNDRMLYKKLKTVNCVEVLFQLLNCYFVFHF